MNTWNRIGSGRGLFLVAVLALLAAPGAFAADAPPKTPAPPAETTANEKTPAGVGFPYSVILKELDLTGETREKFIQTVQERHKALLTWDRDHKERLLAAEKRLEAARKAKDSAAIDAADQEVKGIRADRDELEENFKNELHKILSPQQNAAWACYDMYAGLLRTRRLQQANISDDQKAKIKEICLGLNQDMAALKPGDKKGHVRLREKALRLVEEKVLSAQQNAQIEERPKKDAARK